MVHRPPDSRLLSALLLVDTAYSKDLQSLLTQSASSLSALSAYASASPPAISHVIVAATSCFAGADDALGLYSNAINEWRESLKRLKETEDDVNSIMRDREILVTRLLKASKSQKPNRDSLINLRASLSETSISSSSHNSTSSSKLASAQSELQACEAHLALREQELDTLRVNLIRDGLLKRCRAIMECARVWGEMGQEGLNVLEAVNPVEAMNGSVRSSPSVDIHVQKPLPTPGEEGPRMDQNAARDEGGPPSDLSSITPSQSASQTGAGGNSSSTISHIHHSALPRPYSVSTSHISSTSANSTASALMRTQVNVPPAHLISEYALPTGMVRRITEEPEEEEETSDDEEMGPVEVRENERFATIQASSKGGSSGSAKKSLSVRGRKKSASLNGHVHFPTSASDVGPSITRSAVEKQPRQRSASFFGSIATLFRGRNSSPARSNGKWQTRTDRNLRRGGDSSSDEDEMIVEKSFDFHKRETEKQRRASSVGPGGTSSTAAGAQRLRKRSLQSRKEVNQVDGWLSDEVVSASVSKGAARKSQGKALVNNGFAAQAPSNILSKAQKRSVTTPLALADNPGKRVQDLHTGTNGAEGTGSLSRNSSLSKTSSILINASSARNVTASATARRSASVSTGPKPRTHLRGGSLDLHGPSPLVTAPLTTPKAITSNSPSHPTSRRASSSSVTLPISNSQNKGKKKTRDDTNGAQSLMSIVEDVARLNSKWAHDEVKLEIVKAPPPMTISSIMDTPGAGPSRLGPRRSSSIDEALRGRTVTDERSSPVKQPEPVLHQPVPGLMPLRSALRNSSRTPSPAQPPFARPIPIIAALERKAAVTPNEGLGFDARTVNLNDDDDDTASISTYETGHETFYGEDDEVPIQPPVNGHVEHGQDGTNDSLSSGSTTRNSNVGDGTAPVRRKSVRMSLQPTFSPPPPPVEDFDDGDTTAEDIPSSHLSSGRGRSWQTRTGEGEPDMWVDSSDEDEEYKRARKLLSRISKKY